jgi:MoaA/NifB/PqqE/SkfB family radical SAM enzyme
MFGKIKKIQPALLTIEGNASCQLRCPTCPTTGNGYPPVIGNGYLHYENFRKLLENNSIIKKVELENRGELFLNPDLLKIIEYCFNCGVEIASDGGVNLNAVDEGVLEGLVKFNFKRLRCSIDGATPETYAIYRRGGDFNLVIDHIKTINRFKNVYKTEFPKLKWQFVVFGHNEHELPLARRMAQELGMEFEAKMSWDSSYSPIRNKEFVKEQTGWLEVTREEFAGSTGADYMRSVCLALWRSPRINWDGKVLGCCWNSWGEFGMNAFRDGFIPSINSEGIIYSRRMLMGEVPQRDGLPCSSCPLYSKMRDAGKFLRIDEIQGIELSVIASALRQIYRISGLRRVFGYLRARG